MCVLLMVIICPKLTFSFVVVGGGGGGVCVCVYVCVLFNKFQLLYIWGQLIWELV